MSKKVNPSHYRGCNPVPDETYAERRAHAQDTMLGTPMHRDFERSAIAKVQLDDLLDGPSSLNANHVGDLIPLERVAMRAAIDRLVALSKATETA